MPTTTGWFPNLVHWPTEIADVVEDEVGKVEWANASQAVRRDEGLSQDAGLKKNGLFISLVLNELHASGKATPSLDQLCRSILSFAKASQGRA
jgi:putative ATP-dependent endonuclease of the OLD family